MSCKEYEADIVDMARRADAGAVVETRIRAHLDECAGCAARLARERQLTSALRELACSAPEATRSDAVEADLLRAFAAHHAAAATTSDAPRPAISTGAWRWLAAAATLVLAATLWWGTTQWRPQNDTARETAVSTKPAETSPPASLASSPAPPPVEIADRAPGASTSPPAAAPGQGPPPPVHASAPPGDDAVLRFVSLPTAIGLPELESGRIVRVELATAMLPAYGFDVVPGSESGVLEADVLVGQDDQPRAIRFVNLKTDSRRRQ